MTSHLMLERNKLIKYSGAVVMVFWEETDVFMHSLEKVKY